MRTPAHDKSSAQRGSTAVEFALVLLLFLAFILGAMDMARLLYTWNAATEATRLGARFAVVCDDMASADDVLAKMQQLLPDIQAVELSWAPDDTCTVADCQGVTVEITSLDFQWISPLVGVVLTPQQALPKFSTYLPRESMRQDPQSSTFCTIRSGVAT